MFFQKYAKNKEVGEVVAFSFMFFIGQKAEIESVAALIQTRDIYK